MVEKNLLNRRKCKICNITDSENVFFRYSYLLKNGDRKYSIQNVCLDCKRKRNREEKRRSFKPKKSDKRKNRKKLLSFSKYEKPRRTYKDEIVRRCNVCRCRSDEVPFVFIKSCKSNCYYMHNICHPCRISQNRSSYLKRVKKDPNFSSLQSQKWNNANRKKYNKRRNEWAKKKRRLGWIGPHTNLYGVLHEKKSK